MSTSVYITSVGKFLPGDPISNPEMEEYLGFVHGRPSELGKFVLRQNKIKQRYYAMGKDGQTQYTNTKLAANAIRDAVEKSELSLHDIDYLATASTQGDLLVPGLASLVHGELKIPPIEIASFQSVCASSMMALKSAFLQVKTEEKKAAAVSGSEFSSRFFRPGFYEGTAEVESQGKVPMKAEFLRWTLSDGGGAVLLERRPNTHRPSLKIEWIDLCSYANRFASCMYAGAETNDAEPKPWSHYASPIAAAQQGAIALYQDFDLLKEMIPVWASHYLQLVDAGRIRPNEIDWNLCHYSAHSLRVELIDILTKTGAMIPEEKWFTNLYSKGNTGSASLFIMLEELFNEHELMPGQKILCSVPESGRCVIAFMLLTVV